MIYSVIAGILLFYAIYMFIMMVASRFYNPREINSSDVDHSILIFYPAYKPGKQLLKNIEYMRKQVSDLNAKIYILSQDGEESINKELMKLADYYDNASFSSEKGNSYHHALQFAVTRMSEFSTGQDKIESILIMDPDNFMDKASIQRLIQRRVNNSDVVLSRRVAYSNDTSTGTFDGMSERINDHMMRRAKQVLGLTPELSGSGMMMCRKLFEKAVFRLDRVAPGMDKQLLINMMFEKKDLKIEFDDCAIVYDEKTEDNSSFNRQRLRWFGNQYYNAKKFGLKLIKSGRLSFIDYAIALWRPPRSMQIAFSTLFIPIDILLFTKGFITVPLVTIAAIIINSSILLFLNSERKLHLLMTHTLGFFKVSLTNGYTAFRSMMKSNEGQFIHTRVSK